MMLQRDEAEDFVLATVKQESVRRFTELTFAHPLINMPLTWKGEGVDEVGVLTSDPTREIVKVNPRYFRPAEVETLLGDPKKAGEKLGWKPDIELRASLTTW